MDIIKLTAQFAAVNGKKFLSGITQRESQNPQFAFLKPTHVLFSYFTSLLELYTKILNPTEGIKQRLESNINDKMSILGRCVHRVEYAKQEEIKKKKSTASELEEQYNTIDWYDFEIVETIDIPNLDLDFSEKPVITPRINTEDNDMDMEVDEQVPSITPVIQQQYPNTPLQMQYNQMQPPQQPPQQQQQNTSNLPIRENYRPQPKGIEMKTNTLYDPITHKAIPIDQSQQHLRYSLIDPRYEAQHNKFTEGFQTTNFASDTEIAKNLAAMSQKRPDIFGGDGTYEPNNKRLKPGVQFTGKEFTMEQKQKMFKETLDEKRKAGLFLNGRPGQTPIGPQQPPPSS